jgi:hypothetical protein
MIPSTTSLVCNECPLDCLIDKCIGIGPEIQEHPHLCEVTVYYCTAQLLGPVQIGERVAQDIGETVALVCASCASWKIRRVAEDVVHHLLWQHRDFTESELQILCPS